jgi:hypothetical protein
MPTINKEFLLEILKQRREFGSLGENRINTKIYQYLKRYSPYYLYVPLTDIPLAIVVEVGKDSKILWSCHTDSLDTVDGTKLIGETSEGFLFTYNDDCVLGADDAAGIVLMIGMIEAGIEGTYVFHRGEEIMGWGSRQIAKFHPNWLSGFYAAIAFDRRGQHDIITHQGFGRKRTCSKTFAKYLVKKLSIDGLEFKEAKGVYTDTYEYRKFIPNCTNVSVGYYGEHTPKEILDLNFLNRLLNVVVKAFKPQSNSTISISKTNPDYAYINGSSARLIRTNAHGHKYIIHNKSRHYL